jgi:hypothetical protein
MFRSFLRQRQKVTLDVLAAVVASKITNWPVQYDADQLQVVAFDAEC